jgi:hypothetical protein
MAVAEDSSLGKPVSALQDNGGLQLLHLLFVTANQDWLPRMYTDPIRNAPTDNGLSANDMQDKGSGPGSRIAPVAAITLDHVARTALPEQARHVR